MLDDRRPNFLHQFQIFLDRLFGVTSQESCNHIDAEQSRGVDQRVDMIDIGFALFQVGVHRVRIIAEGGNLHALVLRIVKDLRRLFPS